MQNCLQSKSQTVYQHGESVQAYTLQLIEILKSGNNPGWKLPDWLMTYRFKILERLYSEDIIKEYTLFHDCSKPYCKILDNEGRQHFPNHAERSYKIWLECGGHSEAAELMKQDMDIHLLKSDQIESFAERPQACTLLLAGLAEIKANSELFGGEESVSYKIKYKHIDKKGKAICKSLFEGIK